MQASKISERFTRWDEWGENGTDRGKEARLLSQNTPETGTLIQKGFIFEDGLKSLFFSGSSVSGGVGLWTDPIGIGVALGKGIFTGQAECVEECDL